MIVPRVFAAVGFLLLAAFTLASAYFFHDFWAKAPEEQQAQQMNFTRNVTFAGACLALFALWAYFGEVIDWAVTDQLIDIS